MTQLDQEQPQGDSGFEGNVPTPGVTDGEDYRADKIRVLEGLDRTGMSITKEYDAKHRA